jgi:hypothetical protein
MHPQGIGQRPLALAGRLRQEAQDAGLRRREVQRCEPLSERGGRVRPELGEEEGDPGFGGCGHAASLSCGGIQYNL